MTLPIATPTATMGETKTRPLRNGAFIPVVERELDGGTARGADVLAMARAAERGSPVPAVWALAIAAVLAVWAAYAWAGAGLIPRLPLMRTVLVAISAVYLLRGLVLAPALAA
ncbi:MAG: hypothetical protein KY446_12705 [Proteobacteria bacterium]|nr:hypothetical protein [Pseudomonadota bacterium]